MRGKRQELQFAGADEAGLLVSGLCLVHCLAMPLLLMLIPAVGAALSDPFVHRLLAVLAVLSIAVALLTSRNSVHRAAVLMLGLSGAAIVVRSAFADADLCCSLLQQLAAGQIRVGDIPLHGLVSLSATPVGCLLIAAAHSLRRQQFAQARACARPCSA